MLECKGRYLYWDQGKEHRRIEKGKGYLCGSMLHLKPKGIGWVFYYCHEIVSVSKKWNCNLLSLGLG